MVDLQSFPGAELRWVRSGYLPAAFALYYGEAELGTLAWESLFSSRALARTGGGEWRFRRQGLRGVRIEDATSGESVAEMRFHLLGSGELTFADGRVLAFRRLGMIPPLWSFQDPNGSELVTVRGRLASLWRGGDCRIEPAGASLPEAGLVALLGIYILVRRARRRARR